MVVLGPKTDQGRASKWTDALAPVLLDGEVVRAFARSHPMVTREGIAFTNARIFTFHSEAPEDRRIVDSVANDKIRSLGIDGGLFRSRVWIVTDDGDVPLGTVAKSETGFVEEHVRISHSKGIDPAASEAMELLDLEKAIEKLEKDELLQAREQVPIVGDVMKPSQWEAIHRTARGNELPWLVLNNGRTGVLAAFEDRLVVFKSGMLASAVSGSITLGGGTTFHYDEIIAIQHIGKQLNGSLEVVTPTHPSLTTSLGSDQKIDDERWKRPNCIPMPSIQYTVWSPHIHKIGRKIAAAQK